MVVRYEDLEPDLDAQVEDRLGDSIIYTRAGGAPVIVRGFINLYSDPGAIDGVDATRRRWKVKINKARLPEGPLVTDRISHKKLGAGLYRPGTGTTVDDGNAWLFDIQRATK